MEDFNCFVLNSIADGNDSGVSPQGRSRARMKFGDELEGAGDKSQRLDAMLAWIRETKVRLTINGRSN